MTQHCDLIELQPQPTLIIRSRTAVEDLPRVLGDAYAAVLQYLNDTGELPHGAPFVAYYNMDMQNLDIEAGFPVGRPLPGRDRVQAGEIPGGRYAASLFTGPYHELSTAYETLTEWVLAQGLTVSGVVYEIYLNDPALVPPGELQTQILFPIR